MMNPIWILLFFVASKFMLSALIPLIGDEAYYWVWSNHLQLSYLDHPPFVAWLFKISQFGSDIFGPRWASLLLASGTFFIWIVLSKRLIKNPRTLFLWLCILALSPLLGLGSVIVTPDVPLMFFWSLSTYFLLKIIDHQRAQDYLGLGLSLGLGFCSKYHIVLWPICILLFLLFTKKINLIQWQKLILTAIFGFIMCGPVLMWNYQHDWLSFKFQFEHGLSQGSWEWEWSVKYVLGQAALLMPFIFSKKFFKASNLDTESCIHFFLGWTPLLFFFISSFKGAVEANWPLMSFAHLGLLFFTQQQKPIWGRIYLTFWGFATIAILYCLSFPQANFLHNKLSEPKKYSENIKALDHYRPLYTSTYQMASSIWYFSHIPTFKLRGESRPDFFDQLPESIPSENIFYYLKEDYQDLPDSLIKEGYTFKKLSQPFTKHTLYEVSNK